MVGYQTAAIFLCFVAVAIAAHNSNGAVESSKRVPKEIAPDAKTANEDSDGEATGFGGGDNFGGFDSGGGGSHKYFMDQYLFQPRPDQLEFGHVCEDPDDWEQRYEKHDYKANRRQGQHLPQKDHYEFGYKRGNEHHHKERHEKAHPHHGHFKTKVKWGDKHGGHGEHYWDYNHHGHHGDEGGEADEASETVVDYDKMEEGRKKRDHHGKGATLVYNTETGTVRDEVTGQIYVLYPVNS